MTKSSFVALATKNPALLLILEQLKITLEDAMAKKSRRMRVKDHLDTINKYVKQICKAMAN